MTSLLSFVSDVFTCRAHLAKLVAENSRWRAEVQFLTNENRRLGREFLRAVGHPAVRSETAKTAGWN